MSRWLRVVGMVALAAALPMLRRLVPRPAEWIDAAVPGAPSAPGGLGRKRRWLRLAALFAGFLAVLGIGGLVVAASGIVPIKASAGHWPITERLLKFSMHRSLATNSLGVEVPFLDDPSLVLRGAGHYETGCRPCHGSPDLPHPRVAAAMLPRPPYLPPAIAEWKTRELFYLVKHGVKLTGMPAWPSQQRDDEVWAMTAFLLKLPELDAAGYRRLVHGGAPVESGDPPLQDLLDPQSVPQAVTQTCARCHGVDGRGRGLGAFPRLAGQSPQYLEAALLAYARGDRHSGIMEPVAAGLERREIRQLALYYGGRTGASLARLPQDMTAAVERGRAISRQGIPGQRVPSCADCHGPGAGRRNPAYPRLAGQYADYLVLQLQLFQEGHRGGSPYAHLMHPVASRLTSEQMRDVALYYASLAGDLP